MMWYCSDSTDSLPRSRARNFTSHQPSWYQSSQPSPRTSFFSHPGGDAGGRRPQPRHRRALLARVLAAVAHDERRVVGVLAHHPTAYHEPEPLLERRHLEPRPRRPRALRRRRLSARRRPGRGLRRRRRPRLRRRRGFRRGGRAAAAASPVGGGRRRRRARPQGADAAPAIRQERAPTPALCAHHPRGAASWTRRTPRRPETPSSAPQPERPPRARGRSRPYLRGRRGRFGAPLVRLRARRYGRRRRHPRAVAALEADAAPPHAVSCSSPSWACDVLCAIILAQLHRGAKETARSSSRATSDWDAPPTKERLNPSSMRRRRRRQWRRRWRRWERRWRRRRRGRYVRRPQSGRRGRRPLLLHAK